MSEGRTSNARLFPVYSNIVLESPDGSPLVCISRKHCNWYLRKGLAHIVSDDDPMRVRLKSGPSGRNKHHTPYYLSPKENICVVCGTRDELTSHHCVPYEYRKSFPDEWQKHTPHDVLLLCVACHAVYEKRADEFKIEVAREWGVSPDDPRLYSKGDYVVSGYAHTLLKHRRQIPPHRIAFLEGEVRDHMGVNDLTEDVLRTAVRLRDTKPRLAQLVVENAVADLGKFCRTWRLHFLQTMEPKHMPDLWDVNYVPRDAVTAA